VYYGIFFRACPAGHEQGQKMRSEPIMPHYVNVASGSFLWRGFLLRGVGLQLFYFFSVFQKNKCAAMCVGCKNYDKKN
jgi:hypothetical protein